jgi:hypothetical protein
MIDFRPLVLLRPNLMDMMKGIRWTDLPRTFQEAITITRALSVPYIWIDCLCIIQEDGEDWNIEAPRMEQVYGNSYLNLAALASLDGRGGLFRERRPTSLSPTMLKARSLLLNGSFKIVRQDFWEGNVLDAPLYQRGWVFQGESMNCVCRG